MLVTEVVDNINNVIKGNNVILNNLENSDLQYSFIFKVGSSNVVNFNTENSLNFTSITDKENLLAITIFINGNEIFNGIDLLVPINVPPNSQIIIGIAKVNDNLDSNFIINGAYI